jgi:hypothetical protein
VRGRVCAALLVLILAPACSHPARPKIRSRVALRLSISVNLPPSHCLDDLKLVFLDRTGRLLPADVHHLKAVVVNDTSSPDETCGVYEDAFVRLPTASAYTLLVQPAGKTFGPITPDQLRSRHWKWSVG